jgi:hypothetical protein
MVNIEKLKNHVRHLEEQHSELDRRIDQMEATGHYTDVELSPMKKDRLRIKDEIEQLKETINGHT